MIATPKSIVAVLPATSFPVGTHQFEQRTIEDAVDAAEALVDLTDRTRDTGLSVTLEISYDAGASWHTYTAGIEQGEPNAGPFLGIGIGKSRGLPKAAGRLIRGSFSVTGREVSTSLVVAIW